MKPNKIPVSIKISEYLQGIYGEEWTAKYCQYALEETTDFIRVNTLKTTPEILAGVLRAEYGIESEPVSGIPGAMKIIDPNRVAGKTMEHITGHYYLQSLSSMLPPHVIVPQPHETILDMCAAPGSKTTLLAELMNNTGTLVANELAPNRAGILSFNVERLNVLNCGILQMNGEVLSSYFPEYFDRILVDAPCSGLGIVHKKGEVSNWWSEDMAERLASLQYRLLVSAIKMLKQGGTLVYSTCTLSITENEEVVNLALQKYPVELEEFTLPIPNNPGFTSFGGKQFSDALSRTKRITPWEAGSEGFFIAKFRKTESAPYIPKNAGKLKTTFRACKKDELKPIIQQISEQFGVPQEVFDNYSIVEKSNDYYILSKDWDGGDFISFNKAGLKIGALDKYGNFIIHTNLAQILEKHITKNIITLQNGDEIKRYMDGGLLKNLNTDTKGQAAVKYKDHIIGTGVVHDGALKSRFPRAFRTTAITF